MEEPSRKYEPGKLWKTRTELFGFDAKDKAVVIPCGVFVLLLKHYANIGDKTDFVALFYEQKIVFIKCDVGHYFDLTPSQ